MFILRTVGIKLCGLNKFEEYNVFFFFGTFPHDSSFTLSM